MTRRALAKFRVRWIVPVLLLWSLALTSTSLPFVFDRYTLVGTAEVDSSAPVPDSTASPTLRVIGTPRTETGTYPLVLTVQDFR